MPTLTEQETKTSAKADKEQNDERPKGRIAHNVSDIQAAGSADELLNEIAMHQMLTTSDDMYCKKLRKHLDARGVPVDRMPGEQKLVPEAIPEADKK